MKNNLITTYSDEANLYPHNVTLICFPQYNVHNSIQDSLDWRLDNHQKLKKIFLNFILSHGHF